jgi:hypothetical protein
MTPQNALIITGVGAAIILLYVLYLILRLNCRLDTNIKSTCGKSSPAPAKKAPVKAQEEHPVATCKPEVYTDYAEILVKKLMASSKKVTKDRGLGKKYYHQLLLEIYRKFLKLNSTIINKSELGRSKKFLKEIKGEIKEYETELQHGGAPQRIDEKDLARILNDNELAIYSVYPTLA